MFQKVLCLVLMAFIHRCCGSESLNHYASLDAFFEEGEHEDAPFKFSLSFAPKTRHIAQILAMIEAANIADVDDAKHTLEKMGVIHTDNDQSHHPPSWNPEDHTDPST